MFSLCIPTLERYDNFLSNNLIKYLDNDLINEIIITDENGNDIEKIEKYLNNHMNYNKLVLIKNENVLGPFLNKYKCCLYAKNEWIALIDSDNYADYNYFITAKNFIDKNIKNKNVILAPSFAKPTFDYRLLNNFIYKKGNYINNNNIELTLLNTGNYILNKFLINNINLDNEYEIIKCSYSCDVLFFNTLLFEQLDLHLYVVPNLEYEHVVHNGSIYMNTHYKYQHIADIVHKRYLNLK